MTPVETRLALMRNSYMPTPARGKAVHINGWSTKTATNEAEIRLQAGMFADHTNTGILTKTTPAVDVDITFLPAAEAVEALAREEFEERGHVMVRIGKAPKRAILLRTDEPFKKLTASFTAPDGSKHKIEVLGDGEQVIVDGIHPDTGKPYMWHGGSPLTVRRDKLPYVRREDLESFLDDASKILVEQFGFMPAGGKAKANGAGHDAGQYDRADWAELIGNIIAGRDLHDSIRDLGSSFRSAMSGGAAIRALQSLMLVSTTPHDERWKERFDDIPRSVRGAEEKYERDRTAGEEPIPLFPPLPPEEPYPVEALGPVLSAASSSIARKIQVPLAIAAQSVLGTAALVAQAHANVRLPYGQVRPLSLFLITVAMSGDRKTSADREAQWPIRRREKALKDTYEREGKAHRAEHAAWSGEKRKIDGDKRLGMQERRKLLADLGDAPLPPLNPFLTCPDPTIEGLIKAWPNSAAALGIFSSEGGQFLGGYGMSQDHVLKTSATLSDLWDGTPVKRVRAVDGVTVLHGKRISVHLMVQPEAAAQFLANPLLRDQGLLSRMLAAAPECTAARF